MQPTISRETVAVETKIVGFQLFTCNTDKKLWDNLQGRLQASRSTENEFDPQQGQTCFFLHQISNSALAPKKQTFLRECPTIELKGLQDSEKNTFLALD